MAGHSKWATTKRQKAVTDAKRGAMFTKIGNLIAIAARKGPDPDSNPSLAMAIEKAKAANMPKANIEKAIARITDKSTEQLEEITYEAYGPNGAAFVIEVATDNRNRTLPEVKATLSKNGGRLAEAGSVLFQFEQKGVIAISDQSEEIMMTALEAGAEDVEEEDGETFVYTAARDLMPVRNELADRGLKIVSAELEHIAQNQLDLNDETQEKVVQIMDALDDLDDVVNVHTNVALK